MTVEEEAENEEQGVDEVELINLTKAWWNDTERFDYVNKLLPLELKEGERRKALPEERLRGCSWLVMLAGFTVDPLLQSICVYRPENILLVLSEDADSGAIRKADLETHLERARKNKELAENWLKGSALEVVPTDRVPHHPAGVFNRLREVFLPKLRADGIGARNVIIDITGAKKSMVAGAYLFAAYTNIRVSYVDFDKYDGGRGRPWGYTCRIGILANPYELFSLRNWQKVEELVDKADYERALELTEEVISGSDEKEGKGAAESLFDDTGISCLTTFRNLLQFCAAWNRGDYHAAARKWEPMDVSVQQSAVVSEIARCVKEIANFWPDHKSDPTGEFVAKVNEMESLLPEKSDRSLFQNQGRLAAYAFDELARIERLVANKRDLRSALIRSHGLHETMLKARLGSLSIGPDPQMLVNFGDESKAFDELEPRHKQDVDGYFRRTTGAGKAISALRRTAKNGHESKRAFRISYDPEVFLVMKDRDEPWLDEFWKGNKLWGQFSDLRNKAAHFCLTVPVRFAEQAFEIARANVADWASKLGIELSVPVAPSFFHLTAASGVGEFLPSMKSLHEQSSSPRESKNE